ncbi:exosortase F system-associated protein [uncultured Polaribacter sp.]|uniref:exosortase F system-associated membrane protein n=1 Tax=uncultured Polaribacter sp. TaxID=174711 RepID=UPI002634584D|nr:exosortase F system-associated protein [uncultured Polaribacter sp.]
MNTYLKITVASLLFLMFFAVRAFASELFYDPLVVYFKNDYLYKNIENIDIWRLLVHMFYRYFLNSILSLAIIWVLFQRKEYLKFATFFFLIAFVFLIIVFVFLIKNNFETGYLLPFYIRRFIIHPLLLLLLLPAFYYQKLSKE